MRFDWNETFVHSIEKQSRKCLVELLKESLASTATCHTHRDLTRSKALLATLDLTVPKDGIKACQLSVAANFPVS